jgi:hypoxanthine phosphoribosyltransferase
MQTKMMVTWENFDEWVNNIHSQILKSDWHPDVIIGLVRGGAVPAVSLSHKFNIPCVNFRVAFRDFASRDDMSDIYDWVNVFGRKALVVDDINDTGRTIKYIKDIYNVSNTKFATLIHNAVSTQQVDYYGKMIDKSDKDVWVVFPWEKI